MERNSSLQVNPKESEENMRKKLSPIIWIVAVAIILAACAPKPEAAEPAVTPTETETALVTSEPIWCGGVAYTVVGANEASGECLENDVVKISVDGEIVQGYVRAAFSVYEGQAVPVTWDFDGISADEGVVFTTRCTGIISPIIPTVSADYALTCANEERPWEIEAKFHITALTTTSLQPPAPQVSLIDWPNLVEGQWYLFCAKDGWTRMKYRPEGRGDEETYEDCAAGKVLNKLAYRVLWNLSGEGLHVAVLYPDTVPGGYPFVPTQDLLIGRTYYVCSRDEPPLIYMMSGSDHEWTVETCEEAVFLGNVPTGPYLFNNGQNMYFKDNLPGAFPSPRP